LIVPLGPEKCQLVIALSESDFTREEQKSFIHEILNDYGIVPNISHILP
jgi:hypothetical protein